MVCECVRVCLFFPSFIRCGLVFLGDQLFSHVCFRFHFTCALCVFTGRATFFYFFAMDF